MTFDTATGLACLAYLAVVMAVREFGRPLGDFLMDRIHGRRA